MTDAQTEARAIGPERVSLKQTDGYEVNWYGVVTNEFDEDESTTHYVREDIHATALATERAAHAETKRARDEARKALEPFAWIGQWLFARDLPDETPVVMVEGAGKPFALTRGMFKAAHTAARRALEAQGGENG